MLPVKVGQPKLKSTIYLQTMIDTGATLSLLSARAAKALSLSYSHAPKSIVGVGGVLTTALVGLSEIILWTLTGEKHKVPVVILGSPRGRSKAVDWIKHADDWEHLKKLPFSRKEARWPEVDLLLGCDQAHLTRPLQVVAGGPGEPVAKRTHFRWTCAGKVDAAAPQVLVTPSWITQFTFAAAVNVMMLVTPTGDTEGDPPVEMQLQVDQLTGAEPRVMLGGEEDEEKDGSVERPNQTHDQGAELLEDAAKRWTPPLQGLERVPICNPEDRYALKILDDSIVQLEDGQGD